MEKYYANFQYYDERNRRLSIFGKITGDCIEVVVLTCSISDTFTRKSGRMLYEQSCSSEEGNAKCLGQTYSGIAIKDGNPAKTFNNWCRENFYQQRMESLRVTRLYLQKNHKGKLIPVKNTVKVVHSKFNR